MSFVIEADNISKVDQLYKKSSLYLFVFGSIFFLLIVWNLDDIFALMPKGDIFAAGKWVVVIIGAGKLIDMIFGIAGGAGFSNHIDQHAAHSPLRAQRGSNGYHFHLPGLQRGKIWICLVEI